MQKKNSFVKNAPAEEILSSYSNLEEIYSSPLSPTIIKLAINKSTKYVKNYKKNINYKKCILKYITKSMLINENLKKQAEQEFPLTCKLAHQNIVECFVYGENKDYILGVLEYMPDADYFTQKINENLTPIKNEIKLKSYLTDILEGLVYIHNRGFVHCDLKLENLFLKKFDEEKIPQVKISDLGLAHPIVDDKIFMEDYLGSHAYIAPEGIYVTPKVDVWSLGIVLYKMAVAYTPTQIAGYQYGSGPIPFRKVDWRRRSENLKDFVSKMLEFDPKKRISLEECLQHSWFDSEK